MNFLHTIDPLFQVHYLQDDECARHATAPLEPAFRFIHIIVSDFAWRVAR